MPKTKRSILQPEYMSRFSCIGGACEDSCCVGNWSVYVDKKTFLKYRDVGDAALQPLIDKVLKRYREDDANDSRFGIFRMRRDGRGCPFLTDDKLCRLQSELGYEILCNVCAIYPRIYALADAKLERCATLSCPEIARMALLNPDGIVFETIEEGPSTGRIPPRATSINSKAPEYAAKPAKYFGDIRMLCLTLLQDRRYTMGQRMIILGMLCKKITDFEKEGRVDDIPDMLEKFDASLEDGALKEGLGGVQNNFQIQMKLAKELTDKRLSAELIGSERYLKCIRDTFIGLDFIEGTPAEQMVKKFTENRDTYVAEYLKEKEYILENFIVNEFFIKLMPFETGETAWDSYLFLSVMYGMVKLHLNGMAGCNKGMTDEIAVGLIQSFTKVVLHNTKFMPGMVKLLKDNGFDSLAWMTILVND